MHAIEWDGFTSMFEGDRGLEAAPSVTNVIMLVSFYSVIICAAQDYDDEVFFIDVVQSLLCWPSHAQNLLFAVSIYLMRDIERILGFDSFMYLLFASFCAFVPFYVLVIAVVGFRAHVSLLLFIPYGMFAFYFLRVPSAPFRFLVRDKDVLLALFCALVVLGLPFSLLAAAAGVAGLHLWMQDFLGVRRKAISSISS